EHRNLHREPAGLPDAAFDFLRAQTEVRVARVGVAPRVQDRDDRPAGDVLGAEAGLLRARAVAERSQIVRTEPAIASKVLGLPAAAHASRSRSARATGASCCSCAAPSGDTYGGIGPVRAMPASSTAWCSTRAGPHASRRSP